MLKPEALLDRMTHALPEMRGIALSHEDLTQLSLLVDAAWGVVNAEGGVNGTLDAIDRLRHYLARLETYNGRF
jgi:hypothetical protein